MKKLGVLACIIAGILLTMGIVSIANAQSLVVPQGGASLEVVYTQTFNHVVFTVTWVTDDPNGAWPFHFGDGSEYVIVGESGTTSFSHDYAYVPGGTVSYSASIELVGWTDPWSGLITIDDRQVERNIIFLPVVFRPAPAPYCSISVSSQDVNHVVYDVSWENAQDGVHTFLFGDGTLTQQFSGIKGTGTTWHDYPWPNTDFIIVMNLYGGGSCSTYIHINWP